MSILFADICGFTPLTTTLSVSKLVETLNDLFGKFDEAAEVRVTSALAWDSHDADERRKISCATNAKENKETRLGWHQSRPRAHYEKGGELTEKERFYGCHKWRIRTRLLRGSNNTMILLMTLIVNL